MKKILIVALAVFTMSVQSCKKKEAKPEPPSAKELITQDDWLLTEFRSLDSNGNVISQANPNTKWVFAPSGDYYFYNNSGEVSDYGEWQLHNDDSQIRFIQHEGNYDYTFDIEKLTADEFLFFMEISNGNQVHYKLER